MGFHDLQDAGSAAHARSGGSEHLAPGGFHFILGAGQGIRVFARGGDLDKRPGQAPP